VAVDREIASPVVIDGIDTVVFVNNALSARLVHDELARRDISRRRVALFLLRRLHADWFDDCALVVRYDRPPVHSLVRQLGATGFYLRAARALRAVLRGGEVRRIYVVNNDNLLTNHALGWARRSCDCEVVVIVEGLMNFQDIRLRNRQAWRSRVKLVAAPLLRLSWDAPTTHLSGAYDPRVNRVLTFERRGLKAPLEKIDEHRLSPLNARAAKEERTVLIALSGIWQWITPAEDEALSRGFVAWLESQAFDRVIVKPHPHVTGGALERLLPPHERLGSHESLEDLADRLTAGTVAGICCTALVTLKQLRPDLRCVDFGGEFYCDRGYFGDRSVNELMRVAGVETIVFEPSVASAGQPCERMQL
jgi:hypothetical protein